jgi:hypothetical protein
VGRRPGPGGFGGDVPARGDLTRPWSAVVQRADVDEFARPLASAPSNAPHARIRRDEGTHLMTTEPTRAEVLTGADVPPLRRHPSCGLRLRHERRVRTTHHPLHLLTCHETEVGVNSALQGPNSHAVR